MIKINSLKKQRGNTLLNTTLHITHLKNAERAAGALLERQRPISPLSSSSTLGERLEFYTDTRLPLD